MTAEQNGSGMIRQLCGALKVDGTGPCRKRAGWGTDHVGIGNCRLHFGATRNHRKAAQVEKARQEVVRYGLPLDVHPIDALLEMVREAAGNVAFLRGRVSELDQQRGLVAIPGVTLGEVIAGERAPLGAEGIYGPDHQGDGKRHILVAMYDEERDRLAKFAKLALDAGVDAKLVSIAEAQGQQLAEVVRAAVKAAAAGGEDAGLRAAADQMRRLRA